MDEDAPVSMSALAEAGDPTAGTAQAETPTSTSSPSWTLPAVVRVTASDGLRVRRTPDATVRNNVLGGLAPHAEIEALAAEGDWLRVTLRGQRAYIHSGFVELAPQVDAATDATETVRADGASAEHAPPATHTSTSSPIAATAPSGPSSAGSSTTSQTSTVSAAPAPAPAEPAHPATEGQFTTLSGNTIAKTTAKEAAVLNALRADPRRFDPAWLALAQRNLSVIDATGAMNTETLRAMRTRSGNQSLGVSGILNESFLTGIAPGTPFFAGTEEGFADHAPDGRATRLADRAAQAVGYASYRDYRSTWVSIRFLGKALRGGGTGEGHPYLAARLHVAEAFLRQRHPNMNDDAVIRAIGWNGRGNASYDDQLETTTSHQHTMGLAIDIDPTHNPYIFNESVGGLTHEQAMWWISTFEEMFRIATKVYGGEPIGPATLLEWSRTSSTEELFQRVQGASNAFRQFLQLSGRSKEEIIAVLVGAGYSQDEANALVPSVQKAEARFHGGGGRQHAETITNIQQELLIALRDVAGLSWGGTEMSARENGDFMHFDCRDTEFGRAVYSRRAPRHR